MKSVEPIQPKDRQDDADIYQSTREELLRRLRDLKTQAEERGDSVMLNLLKTLEGQWGGIIYRAERLEGQKYALQTGLTGGVIFLIIGAILETGLKGGEPIESIPMFTLLGVLFGYIYGKDRYEKEEWRPEEEEVKNRALKIIRDDIRAKLKRYYTGIVRGEEVTNHHDGEVWGGEGEKEVPVSTSETPNPVNLTLEGIKRLEQTAKREGREDVASLLAEIARRHAQVKGQVEKTLKVVKTWGVLTIIDLCANILRGKNVFTSIPVATISSGIVAILDAWLGISDSLEDIISLAPRPESVNKITARILEMQAAKAVTLLANQKTEEYL